VALVKVLLAAHANVHIKDARGETALSEAVAGGHDEIAALLRAAAAGALVERPR
jgi:ankyrin repeat protein